jgi:hypothetical protein
MKVRHTRLMASNNWSILSGKRPIDSKYFERIITALSSWISSSVGFFKPKISINYLYSTHSIEQTCPTLKSFYHKWNYFLIIMKNRLMLICCIILNKKDFFFIRIILRLVIPKYVNWFVFHNYVKNSWITFIDNICYY